MCELHESARQLPTGHLSVRVPWHDDGWKGTVCRRPSQNAACLILNRIRDVRNDELEEASAGRTILELDDQEVRSSRLPGCIQERGSFMAPFDFTRMVSHPYSGTSASHKHFLPTVYRHPPYSAACIPFLWMMSETAIKKAEDLGLDYRPEFEPELGFKTIWVQDKLRCRTCFEWGCHPSSSKLLQHTEANL